MTFTIDGAQWTYEADINRKKCKLVNFARHQALTKTVSNLMRFQEHSDNSRLPTTQRDDGGL